MAMYVRNTRSVRIGDLPTHVRDKLTAHAESRQRLDQCAGVAHPERKPSCQFDFRKGVVTGGAKLGTALLSLPLTRASVIAGTGLGHKLDRVATEQDGFTITGFHGEQPGSYYIGMVPEPEAADCFSAVRSAIAAVKHPS